MNESTISVTSESNSTDQLPKEQTLNEIDKVLPKAEEAKVDDEKPTLKKVESSLFERMNLPICMLTKTGMCKHSHGCYENTLRGWYKTFISIYILKALLSNLSSIVNPSKFIKNL